jgi:hypothetical protein
VNSLLTPEWIAEFDRLKKVNGEIMAGKGEAGAKKRESKVDR